MSDEEDFMRDSDQEEYVDCQQQAAVYQLDISQFDIDLDIDIGETVADGCIWCQL